MDQSEKKEIRVAILDLYEGEANQGMRCIREIIAAQSKESGITITYDEFDVRRKLELPDLSYDAYISSGGPGSPTESEGMQWEIKFFNWIKQTEDYNNNILNEIKKPVLFICHSFQLACRYYNIGKVCKRRSTSFGVFPVHMLEEAFAEPLFEGLSDPFYVVDSRDYQVISPDAERLQQLGAAVLCIEKERPYVPLERSLMAVRFNEHFIGTQFHPEADALSMGQYLQQADKKQAVIHEHGEAKWQSMVEQLQDPDKIIKTYHTILPNFLSSIIGVAVV
ncbi:type 1 glutamine amidotransferase [Chitinophagaceae bacterium LWZ2-11]